MEGQVKYTAVIAIECTLYRLQQNVPSVTAAGLSSAGTAAPCGSESTALRQRSGPKEHLGVTPWLMLSRPGVKHAVGSHCTPLLLARSDTIQLHFLSGKTRATRAASPRADTQQGLASPALWAEMRHCGPSSLPRSPRATESRLPFKCP